MPVNHSIKAFMAQQSSGGVPILEVKTSNVQTIYLGTSIKKLVSEILNYGTLKKDMNQILNLGVTNLTSRAINHPYFI